MAQAIECAKSENANYNKAAELYGVPNSILKDYLSGLVEVGCRPGPQPYLHRSEDKRADFSLLTASVHTPAVVKSPESSDSFEFLARNLPVRDLFSS